MNTFLHGLLVGVVAYLVYLVLAGVTCLIWTKWTHRRGGGVPEYPLPMPRCPPPPMPPTKPPKAPPELARKEESTIKLLLSEWHFHGVGLCNCDGVNPSPYLAPDHSQSCNYTRMLVAAKAVVRYDARVAEEGEDRDFRKARRTRKRVQREAKAKGNTRRLAAMKAARAR